FGNDSRDSLGWVHLNYNVASWHQRRSDLEQRSGSWAWSEQGNRYWSSTGYLGELSFLFWRRKSYDHSRWRYRCNARQRCGTTWRRWFIRDGVGRCYSPESPNDRRRGKKFSLRSGWFRRLHGKRIPLFNQDCCLKLRSRRLHIILDTNDPVTGDLNSQPPRVIGCGGSLFHLGEPNTGARAQSGTLNG